MSSDSDSSTGTRGRPFEPGQSGNPKGRPKGSRNTTTLMAEALLDGEAEAITRKLIEKALEGDSAALRLSLERLVPPKRQRYVSFDFDGEIKTPADALRASTAVLSACADGQMSSEEAQQIMSLIQSHVQIVQVADLAERLEAVERATQR